jgi:hypothetical protein
MICLEIVNMSVINVNFLLYCYGSTSLNIACCCNRKVKSISAANLVFEL